jgi:hypothetical protein
MHRFHPVGLIAALLMVSIVGVAEGTPVTLTNADFSAGLTGWTTFVTANGSLGPAPLPSTQSFDVDGDSVPTPAAWFQVGEQVFTGLQEGGGIFQSFTTGAGTLTMNADIAVFTQGPSNASGGIFTMLLDNVAVAVFDSGNTTSGQTERSSLNAVVAVGAGSHEIRFLMTRPFIHGTLGETPFQYIDDVALDLNGVQTPIPEPATLSLFGAGLAAAWARSRRTARRS